MLKRFAHYLRVYGKFVSTSTQVQASFRTSFILLILMDLFFYTSSLASVSFIYDHVTTIGPWEREQLMFFISFMLVVDAIHMMVFSHNFWQLSLYIKRGDLDFILLKPISSIFSCFFREFRTPALISFPVAIALLINYGTAVNLTWVDWVLMPFFVLLSLTLLVIIEFIMSSAMFWMVEGIGINFLRMQMQQLSRWPNFIFSELIQRVLTLFLPVLLIGSGPVHFIFEKSRFGMLLSMVLAIIIFSQILRFVWNQALNHYESASS